MAEKDNGMPYPKWKCGFFIKTIFPSLRYTNRFFINSSRIFFFLHSSMKQLPMKTKPDQTPRAKSMEWLTIPYSFPTVDFQWTSHPISEHIQQYTVDISKENKLLLKRIVLDKSFYISYFFAYSVYPTFW